MQRGQDRLRPWIAAGVVIAAGLAATPASALQTPLAGMLEITVGALALQAPLEAVVDVEVAFGYRVEAIHFAEGAFHVTGVTAPVPTSYAASAFPVVGLQLTVSNAMGTLHGTFTPFETSAHGLAGVVPLRGVARVCLFHPCGDPAVVYADVPLSPIGAGGTVTAEGPVNVTVGGAPWIDDTSDPARPPDVGVESPIYVYTNLGAFPSLGGSARLMLAAGNPCSNGIDDDHDGATDWPDDGGCSSADDFSERSTYYAPCDDTIDGDGDGRAAFPEDPGCASPSDDFEEVQFGPGVYQIDAASSVPDDSVVAYHATEDTLLELVDGGLVGYDLIGHGKKAQVHVLGGTVGRDLVSFDGSAVELLGGSVLGGLRLERGNYWGAAIRVAGGSVTGGATLEPRGGSQRHLLEIEDGAIGGSITADHSGSIVQSGGTIGGSVDLVSTASLELRGGTIAGLLNAGGQARVSASGGTLASGLEASGSARVVVPLETLGGAVAVRDTAYVRIYGVFDVPSGPITDLAGTIHGTSMEGAPLAVPFERDATATLVVPEPDVGLAGAAAGAAVAALRAWRRRVGKRR